MANDCLRHALKSPCRKRQRLGCVEGPDSDDEPIAALLGVGNAGPCDPKLASSSSASGEDSDWSDDLDDRKPVQIFADQQRASNALAALSDVAKTALLDALTGPANGHSMEFANRRANVNESMKQGSMNLQCDFNSCNHDMVCRAPCFTELKEHQRIGVRWMLALNRCVPGMVLADEMGLGKTLQTLCFLEVLASPRPSLVLAPASLLDNWVAEAKRWTPKIRTLKYHGFNHWERREIQQALRDQAYQLVIATSQATECKEDRSFFSKTMFEYVVLDEAHCLKRTTTKQHRNLTRITCRRRLLLTGTPVQNSLSELATLLGFALHNQHEPSASISKEVASHLRSLSKKTPVEAVHQFQVAAAPFIMRRLKADVLGDLPAKRGKVVYCEMENEQRQQYHAELTSCSNRFSAMSCVMEAFHRLRRICLHPLLRKQDSCDEEFSEFIDYVIQCRTEFQSVSRVHVEREVSGWSDFEKHKFAKEHGLPNKFSVQDQKVLQVAKMSSLLTILREQISNGNKTLVFSQFTQVLDIIEEALKIVGVAFCRMDGSTLITDRHAIVSSFQSPGGPLVFLMTTKTGGMGLNLTAANVVVMYDLDFNPQNTRQAEDRVHRLGQIDEVVVYYLVCRDTVEEMVLKRNCAKLQLDAHFGARRAALEIAATDEQPVSAEGGHAVECDTIVGDGSAESKACIRQITSELKELLLHNSQSVLSTSELLAILPQDAPPTHIAHTKVKHDSRDDRYYFEFTSYMRRKVHFQSTVKQAGSRLAAQIIARVCYLRFECGWTKNRVQMFKQECYERLRSARAEKSSHVTDQAKYDFVEDSGVSSMAPSEEDSDTSTEWTVLPAISIGKIERKLQSLSRGRNRLGDGISQTSVADTVSVPIGSSKPIDLGSALTCSSKPVQLVASLGSDDETASDTSTEVVLVSRVASDVHEYRISHTFA